MGLHRRVVALGAVLALSPLVGIAQAAQPARPHVIVDSDAPVFWQSTARESARTYDRVPACRTTGCDRLTLRVSVPSELQHRPGGIQVAVRWTDPAASLGLYAVRGDQVVASSTGQIGTAQSLLLPKANAVYDVYVSLQPFDPSVAPDDVAYEGLAENEDSPPVEPVRELLPDLRVLPQRHVTFDTPPPFFDDAAPSGSSCFATEIEEQGAQTCLRFGQAAENLGAGPVDLRFSTDPAAPEADAVARQRVYRSDGTFRERDAGVMEYHVSHGHYHFEGFSQSWLYRLDADGAPETTLAATGRKNGFCMADTEMALWGQKGDAPQTYPAPRCLEPTGQEDGRQLFTNGISVGWADEYAWFLPDQMIEASGLTDGRYHLVTRVDADGRLLESDESNNCVAVDVLLTGLGVQPAATVDGDPRPC